MRIGFEYNMRTKSVKINFPQRNSKSWDAAKKSIIWFFFDRNDQILVV